MKNFYSPYDIMLLLLFYFHSLHSAKLIEMCIRSQGYIQKATTKKKHAYDYLFWLEKKMFSNCWSCGSQIWRQPPATEICCKFYKSFWKTFFTEHFWTTISGTFSSLPCFSHPKPSICHDFLDLLFLSSKYFPDNSR